MVRLGDVTIIGATKERPNSFNLVNPNAAIVEQKNQAVVMQCPVLPEASPAPKGRKSIFYTIGNRMKYRNIALDLVPGRFDKNKRNTAPQDWYVLYAEGGLLRKRLEQNTQRVQGADKISGFKNLGTIRGELGL